MLGLMLGMVGGVCALGIVAEAVEKHTVFKTAEEFMMIFHSRKRA